MDPPPARSASSRRRDSRRRQRQRAAAAAAAATATATGVHAAELAVEPQSAAVTTPVAHAAELAVEPQSAAVTTPVAPAGAAATPAKRSRNRRKSRRQRERDRSARAAASADQAPPASAVSDKTRKRIFEAGSKAIKGSGADGAACSSLAQHEHSIREIEAARTKIFKGSDVRFLFDSCTAQGTDMDYQKMKSADLPGNQEEVYQKRTCSGYHSLQKSEEYMGNENVSSLNSSSLQKGKKRRKRGGKKNNRRKKATSQDSPAPTAADNSGLMTFLSENCTSPGKSLGFPKKKLLILDLNGLLADINEDRHNAHMADAKVRGKLVFRRPYCDDFLNFCALNFELGIWSSRKKENVASVVNIVMSEFKPRLLFCWDLSKCTSSGQKTLENKHKPLVLKELRKLWNVEEPDLPWEKGDYSPSNTLLVDDSPYKALRNPPYTAIFPRSYSYLNGNDNSLGPGGDLRVYLQNLAAADDVQHFVRANPFGQPFITESNPHWNFYAKIAGRGSAEKRYNLRPRKN